MAVSWRQKRKRLLYLIKFVSDMYGGDDIEFLKEYAREVLEAYKDDLDTALSCFTSLTEGRDITPNHEPENASIIDLCESCGYRPPFCRFDKGNGCSFEQKEVKTNV
jgi:hypothetical protein